MTNPLYDRLFSPHKENSKPFLVFSDKPSISYHDFLVISGKMAALLRANGINPGDRVALQADKSPEALALYAACLQTGAVFLPLNTAYTSTEVSYFLEDAEPGVFICSPDSDYADKACDQRTGPVVFTLAADGNGSLMTESQSMDSDQTVSVRNPDDLAALLYTSGTTGRSKGAMLTHDNLLSNAEALVQCWQFSEDDVLLHALPIYHTHGLFVATNTILLAGASAIFHGRFSVDQVISSLPDATSMMGVPTFYTRLLDDSRFNQNLVAHMRLFTSGSAPLLADTHIAFEERTGHRILERYGMTETSMSTSNPYDGERKAGTVGIALPQIEVRVCDPESAVEVPVGEIGVLEVRGPNVFTGYWKLPEKTAEEFRDDGFFITGDLSTIDPDGYVKIVGRDKDLIISGGLNVYPKEVELLLDEQTGVVESAVVGVPHPDFGEAVLGVLVLEDDVVFDEQKMLTDIESKLAKFKQPKRLFVLSNLPRNSMGKVQKNSLRETYAGTYQ